MKMKSALLSGLMLALAGAGWAKPHDRAPIPDVPDTLEVPADAKVIFHAYAVGVQIYTATVSPTDPTKLVWTFTAPEAILFDFDGEVVGYHYAYAGPTRPAWETLKGGLVVAARNVPPVVVDPAAIPWLRLDTVETSGPGLFKHTDYIHRVNTTGGLAPAAAPTQAGQQVRVPYTAEYIFYKGHP